LNSLNIYTILIFLPYLNKTGKKENEGKRIKRHQPTRTNICMKKLRKSHEIENIPIEK